MVHPAATAPISRSSHVTAHQRAVLGLWRHPVRRDRARRDRSRVDRWNGRDTEPRRRDQRTGLATVARDRHRSRWPSSLRVPGSICSAWVPRIRVHALDQPCWLRRIEDVPQAEMHDELANASVLPPPVPLDVTRPVADRGDGARDAGRGAGHDRACPTPCRRPAASCPTTSAILRDGVDAAPGSIRDVAADRWERSAPHVLDRFALDRFLSDWDLLLEAIS